MGPVNHFFFTQRWLLTDWGEESAQPKYVGDPSPSTNWAILSIVCGSSKEILLLSVLLSYYDTMVSHWGAGTIIYIFHHKPTTTTDWGDSLSHVFLIIWPWRTDARLHRGKTQFTGHVTQLTQQSSLDAFLCALKKWMINGLVFLQRIGYFNN